MATLKYEKNCELCTVISLKYEDGKQFKFGEYAFLGYPSILVNIEKLDLNATLSPYL